MEDRANIENEVLFNKLVNIDPDEMCRAQTIVESVNTIVYNTLRDNFPQFKMRQTEPFLLQGSVIDGAKVTAPNEFDYMIPMDVSVDKWDKMPYRLSDDKTPYLNPMSPFENCSSVHLIDCAMVQLKNLYCIVRREHHKKKTFKGIFNECRKRKISVQQRQITKIRKWKAMVRLRRYWRNDLFKTCQSCKLKYWPAISADEVFDGFLLCISKLEDLVQEKFVISSILNYTTPGSGGPAITLEAAYKSDDFLDLPDSTLTIDYVPAVCLGGRCFVPKAVTIGPTLKHWRESFSNDELLLMKEIKSQITGSITL